MKKFSIKLTWLCTFLLFPLHLFGTDKEPSFFVGEKILVYFGDSYKEKFINHIYDNVSVLSLQDEPIEEDCKSCVLNDQRHQLFANKKLENLRENRFINLIKTDSNRIYSFRDPQSKTFRKVFSSCRFKVRKDDGSYFEIHQRPVAQKVTHDGEFILIFELEGSTQLVPYKHRSIEISEDHKQTPILKRFFEEPVIDG